MASNRHTSNQSSGRTKATSVVPPTGRVSNRWSPPASRVVHAVPVSLIASASGESLIEKVSVGVAGTLRRNRRITGPATSSEAAATKSSLIARNAEPSACGTAVGAAGSG